jgi:hypothetical protein
MMLSDDGNGEVAVSYVVPCLNEVQSLPACLRVVEEARRELFDRLGLASEVLVADNGSIDGSQALAVRGGARVVQVGIRGYGAALRGGFDAARGKYLVMGDADGSYDFRQAAPMVEALIGGADLCMGDRFAGGIQPGAMPWKNRYIGNPLLTGLLNLLFRARVRDAHCGLRALTRDCYRRLGLTGSGMEFASEMVIKAALRGQVIAQRPATLSRDLRGRAPHLRPWRDGWRHLRYLFMLSPSWLFALPALSLGTAGSAILVVATVSSLFRPGTPIFFGDYWVVLAGAMVGVAQIAGILAVASHLHGVREGYRRPKRWIVRLSRFISLETMIAAGIGLGAIGFAVLIGVVLAWWSRNFGRAVSVLPAVIGSLLMTLGAQNVLGGFLLAIVSGNEANFLDPQPIKSAESGDGAEPSHPSPLPSQPPA